MSSHDKPGRARVRCLEIPRFSLSKGISVLEGVCAAWERSRDIQRSEPGRQALRDLRTAVTAASKTLALKQDLRAQIPQASKAVKTEVDEVAAALRLYETAAAAVSRGDASVMRSAGLRARARDGSRVFGAVTGVTGKPGVHAMEGVVGWPEVPRAAKYVLEVRFSPDSPGDRWRPAGTGRLRQALERAKAAQGRKTTLVASLATTSSALDVDYSVAGTALRTYERMAGNVSGGDPVVLAEAGLGSGDDLPETVPIPRKVTGVRGRPGEHAKEARLAWDPARGAEGYAIQTRIRAPDDPQGEWVDLPAGNRRAYRVVLASMPGAHFYVRVAAIGRDRVTMEWSDPVLVTAC